MKVRVRSRNGGRAALSKERRALLVDFIIWTAERMMPGIKTLEVDVILDGKLFEKTRHYGMAIWEDRHVKGRKFSIEIDSTFSFVGILSTAAHEMVHVKQWATGEYYALLNRPEHYVFHKETVDANSVDYWELPWEIEAYGRSVGLLVMWMKAKDLTKEDWAKEKIFLV